VAARFTPGTNLGAASFTIFVKGAGFDFSGYHQHQKCFAYFAKFSQQFYLSQWAYPLSPTTGSATANR